MLHRISLAFIPDLSLHCLNSDPVPRRIGQVVYRIIYVMPFSELFLCFEPKITGLSLSEQPSFS